MISKTVIFALVVIIQTMAAPAETVILERTIRANAIIAMEDLKVIQESIPGMIANPDQIAGLEARQILYAGRPIRPQDVRAPAIVERNQLVGMVYQSGPLTISTEGRALGRAGIGDRVKVLNLASRKTVAGIVGEDGSILVGN